MDKNVKYYMSLPYTRELIPEAEGGWFVRIKELPNCMSQGDTPEEALRMIEDAMQGWLEVELEDGEFIPEPRPEEDYSGRFVVRVPKSLHRKLVEAAEEDGVSLNQWINSALAEAVGFNARRVVLKPVDDDEITEDDLWPGLKPIIKKILLNVGMRDDAGVLDEQLFSVWFEQNLKEIRIDTQNGIFDQALVKSNELLRLLSEYQTRSPVIKSICEICINQVKLLGLLYDMNDQIQESERVRIEISKVVSSVNSRALNRPQILEDERHSGNTPPQVPIPSLDKYEFAKGW